MRLPPDGIYAKAPLPHALWEDRWPNFTAAEFACKHCGQYVHSAKFLDKIQALRFLIDKPFKINSGHRCKIHNAKITGNPNSRSQHLNIAADIDLTGHDRHEMANLADSLGFTGIGFGKTFLHVDLRPGPKVTWFYPDSKESWKK